MMSPTPLVFAAILSTTGVLFCVWHFWRYDKCRCLLFSKENAFRFIMCWTIIVALICLTTFTWLQAFVVYDLYYIPLGESVIPVPAQLWPNKHRQIWRASLYVLSVGWVCMHAVHLEEFLYWGYLITSVKYPSRRTVTWFQSMFFKVWVGGSLVCAALVAGAVSVEQDDVMRMKAWTFLLGGCLSTVLAFASTALSILLPNFLKSVQSAGASTEVVSRLAFYQELHFIRTVCRWVFGVASIILSADGVSKRQTINRLDFWPDFLMVVSLLAIFWALMISVIVLLPRNITSEAQPGKIKATMREFQPQRESFHPKASLPSFSSRAKADRVPSRNDHHVDLKQALHSDGTDSESKDRSSSSSTDPHAHDDQHQHPPAIKALNPIKPSRLRVNFHDRLKPHGRGHGSGHTDPRAQAHAHAHAHARTNTNTHSSGHGFRNLHVLGERLNIDSEQLKALTQDEHGNEAPRLDAPPRPKNKDSLSGHGKTDSSASNSSVFGDSAAVQMGTDTAKGKDAGTGTGIGIGHGIAIGPAIHIHPPSVDYSIIEKPAPAVVRSKRSGEADKQDTADSLSYEQPRAGSTTIGPAGITQAAVRDVRERAERPGLFRPSTARRPSDGSG